ncbi:MAG: M48 family metallopeptidase [Woeseiaceae bacterium]|nr:M48 family metallopeptidase [Woeseiaceae bacterium]
MNFFEAQDRARRASKWLVLAYALATLLIVAGVTAIVGAAFYLTSDPLYRSGTVFGVHSSILILTALLTTLVIIGATGFKTATLSSGGGKVAAQLGGTQVSADTTDPLRKRLHNVVEEMAIASGVPVPEVYVLEEESGINAFAAGYAPTDAAVAVTRGALELLDRDELQGVIAHEFSHILNGDMRLNIRLMGILFGIMVLGLAGRFILRGSHHIGRSRDRGAFVVLIVGLGLAILGAVGVLFARVIKSSVSRQREYLADASAVQFTRQNTGIAGALKKIGGYTESSYIKAADPEEVSHMLFGRGSRLFGIFATHPPLTDRIKALDPDFDESQYPHVDVLAMRHRTEQGDEEGLASDLTSGLAEVAAAGAAPAAAAAASIADSVTESAGQPSAEHVRYAQQLRRSIPTDLHDAAHSVDASYLLAVALILNRSGDQLDRQLQLVGEQLGAERAEVVRQYYERLSTIDARFRLPLLSIAFPALKRRPAPQLEFLAELAERLIDVDGEIDLYEFCYYRILSTSLSLASSPSTRLSPKRARRRDVRASAAKLLTIVSIHGHPDADQREAAYRAGAERLGDWASSDEIRPSGDVSVSDLDSSLDTLLALNGKSRRQLVSAISTVAGHDGRLSVAERELIRATCATLECPLPPILFGDTPDQTTG